MFKSLCAQYFSYQLEFYENTAVLDQRQSGREKMENKKTLVCSPAWAGQKSSKYFTFPQYLVASCLRLSSVVPRGTSYNSRKSELQVDSVPNDKAKNKK